MLLLSRKSCFNNCISYISKIRLGILLKYIIPIIPRNKSVKNNKFCMKFIIMLKFENRLINLIFNIPSLYLYIYIYIYILI